MRAHALSVRWFLGSCALVGAMSLAGAACSTQENVRGEGRFERMGTVTQDLSVGNFFGTSLPPKTLALTFDDGPGDRAAELSAYLKSENIRAAFFVNGARIDATNLPNPNGLTPTANVDSVLAQIQADGHLLANHTVTHRDLVTEVLPTGSGKLLSELADTDDSIKAYVPFGHFLFRPPYGSWNAAVYNDLKNSAMNKYVGPVNWDMGGSQSNYPDQAADWACWQGQLYNGGGGLVNGTGYATTKQCGDAYLADIGTVGRGIVLMHDPYFWAQGNTVDMVKYIVPKLKAQGYAFVRVDEVPDIAAQLQCDAACATCAPLDGKVCASCAKGSYLADGKCLTCSTCAAGTFQSTACSANADVACSACSSCATGTYAASACTATANTVCAACDPACVSCTGPTANDCAACPNDAYLSGGACKACTVCAKGTFQTSACTSTTDAVCSPCAAGTAQPEPGKLACTTCAAGTFAAAGAESCTPCAKGTFADKPGAAACATCEAGCDDGDACTVDTCEAATGCVHAAIAACEPDAGADGGPVVDAGPSTDAAAEVDGGSEPEPPAGSEDSAPVNAADASTPSSVPVTGGGSGCSTSGQPREGGASAVMLGALCVCVLRRRAKPGLRADA